MQFCLSSFIMGILVVIVLLSLNELIEQVKIKKQIRQRIKGYQAKKYILYQGNFKIWIDELRKMRPGDTLKVPAKNDQTMEPIVIEYIKDCLFVGQEILNVFYMETHSISPDEIESALIDEGFPKNIITKAIKKEFPDY